MGEGFRYPGHGVFSTMMQAIHRLNVHHGYRRIIASVSTQSNKQLASRETTVSTHLKKMFGIRSAISSVSFPEN